MKQGIKTFDEREANNASRSGHGDGHGDRLRVAFRGRGRQDGRLWLFLHRCSADCSSAYEMMHACKVRVFQGDNQMVSMYNAAIFRAVTWELVRFRCREGAPPSPSRFGHSVQGSDYVHQEPKRALLLAPMPLRGIVVQRSLALASALDSERAVAEGTTGQMIKLIDPAGECAGMPEERDSRRDRD